MPVRVRHMAPLLKTEFEGFFPRDPRLEKNHFQKVLIFKSPKETKNVCAFNVFEEIITFVALAEVIKACITHIKVFLESS